MTSARSKAVHAPYAGGCVCGAVRFRLNGEPLTLYACHCTECQQRSGSGYGLSMWVKREDLQLLEGDTVVRAYTHPNGRQKARRVCPACGTFLWSEPPSEPSLAVLRPGALDARNEFEPVAHIYMRSALPWTRLPEGAKQYEAAPESFSELTALWQAQHPPEKA